MLSEKKKYVHPVVVLNVARTLSLFTDTISLVAMEKNGSLFTAEGTLQP